MLRMKISSSENEYCEMQLETLIWI